MNPDTKPFSVHTPIKGVVYKCGCCLGSDPLAPLFAFSPTCLSHDQPIEKIILPERPKDL